uniref:Uncharacterized protein n=1 Tax=Lactuca sativa TaxID=4236 RepID=A0A9R1VRY1_LACSA|nr:hypothetical protein LSAT_V11C400160850 [Lactuca sativa]
MYIMKRLDQSITLTSPKNIFLPYINLKPSSANGPFPSPSAAAFLLQDLSQPFRRSPGTHLLQRPSLYFSFLVIFVSCINIIHIAAIAIWFCPQAHGEQHP